MQENYGHRSISINVSSKVLRVYYYKTIVLYLKDTLRPKDVLKDEFIMNSIYFGNHFAVVIPLHIFTTQEPFIRKKISRDLPNLFIVER